MSLPDSRLETGRMVFVQRQAANIYTMMLIIAFLAITLGCLFLYLEMKAYDMSIKVPSDAKVPSPPVIETAPPAETPEPAAFNRLPHSKPFDRLTA